VGCWEYKLCRLYYNNVSYKLIVMLSGWYKHNMDGMKNKMINTNLLSSHNRYQIIIIINKYVKRDKENIWNGMSNIITNIKLLHFRRSNK
jgi:hypothetical protein